MGIIKENLSEALTHRALEFAVAGDYKTCNNFGLAAIAAVHAAYIQHVSGK